MVLILECNSEIDEHVRSNLLLFELFDYIEGSHKSYFFFSKKIYFSSYMRNMFRVTIQYKGHTNKTRIEYFAY